MRGGIVKKVRGLWKKKNLKQLSRIFSISLRGNYGSPQDYRRVERYGCTGSQSTEWPKS